MTKVTILLTKGNLNNNHFYLTSCLNLFPPDSVGGKNAAEHATVMLKIRPASGEVVFTDIDGTKNIFRKRGWVGKMFKAFEAKVDDLVEIEKITDFAFNVTVVSGVAR